MAHYVLNKIKNDGRYHEVHKKTCIHLPDLKNQIDLGFFGDCRGAITKGKMLGYNPDGCYYCCKECHRG
jgi:NAD-dependent dihydropyrimidine dehydrogenase PreA subunit